MAAWPTSLPDAFFGVVTQVVRTQLPGPTRPDLDAWIAAGAPAEPLLAARWEQVRTLKNLDGRARLGRPRDPDAAPEDSTAALDHAISTWPAEHWARFLLAYVKLDLTLTRRGITLPPIGT
jgi:hypothetical protein